jgi:hypothetical protein
MRCVRSSFGAIGALVMATLLASCSDGPRASVEITGARAFRAPDKHVVVDVDLVASEGLGGNIGTYCTRVTFTGQENPAEQCFADLSDGDTRTVRLVSEKDLDPGASIVIRVRLGNIDVGRTLAAPPR